MDRQYNMGGRVLEVAQNVATLDGFVSLGKSNVTKKDF